MIRLYSIFSFLFVAVVILCGCEPLAIVNTAVKVEATDLDKVESIVHSTFIDYGARYSSLNGERQYLLFKFNTSAGPIGPQFYVTYEAKSGKIIVNIQNREVSRAHLTDSRGYLLEILDTMNRRFKEAGLRATVEMSSQWVPIPAI